MEGFQNELSEAIYTAIGFDRFFSGLSKLHFVPDAPHWLQTDNWIWRALAERRAVVTCYEDGSIAPSARPSDKRKIKNKKLQIATERLQPPTTEEPTKSEFELQIDRALGENSLAPNFGVEEMVASS